VYPVTQDFHDKMKADRRQVTAKAVIDYTDPSMDQSIEPSANEEANVSYPMQTADSVETPAKSGLPWTVLAYPAKAGGLLRETRSGAKWAGGERL
jgi:hypothetical protein